MKSKHFFLASLVTISSVAFASGNSAPDVRKAVALGCQSEGLGYFNLLNLDGDATYVANRTNPIVITAKTKRSISFKLVNSKDLKYSLVFSKVVQHDEGQGLAGVFVNGDVETSIECNVYTK